MGNNDNQSNTQLIVLEEVRHIINSQINETKEYITKSRYLFSSSLVLLGVLITIYSIWAEQAKELKVDNYLYYISFILIIYMLLIIMKWVYFETPRIKNLINDGTKVIKYSKKEKLDAEGLIEELKQFYLPATNELKSSLKFYHKLILMMVFEVVVILTFVVSASLILTADNIKSFEFIINIKLIAMIMICFIITVDLIAKFAALFPSQYHYYLNWIHNLKIMNLVRDFVSKFGG